MLSGGDAEGGENGGALLAADAVAPHGIDRGVVRDAKEPGRGVFRHSLMRPGLPGAEHGFLHGLFGEFEMSGSEEAGEMRENAAGLMPEQMFQYRAGVIA